MRQLNVNILNAVDTSSQNGAQIDANQLIAASFQAIFGDSTVSGTLNIQSSNDVSTSNNNFVVTNWTNIPNATASISAGASALITINPMCYRWIRASFAHSGGGSSTIKVNMFAQSI